MISLSNKFGFNEVFLFGLFQYDFRNCMNSEEDRGNLGILSTSRNTVQLCLKQLSERHWVCPAGSKKDMNTRSSTALTLFLILLFNYYSLTPTPPPYTVLSFLLHTLRTSTFPGTFTWQRKEGKLGTSIPSPNLSPHSHLFTKLTL